MTFTYHLIFNDYIIGLSSYIGISTMAYEVSKLIALLNSFARSILLSFAPFSHFKLFYEQFNHQ